MKLVLHDPNGYHHFLLSPILFYDLFYKPFGLNSYVISLHPLGVFFFALFVGKCEDLSFELSHVTTSVSSYIKVFSRTLSTVNQMWEFSSSHLVP